MNLYDEIKLIKKVLSLRCVRALLIVLHSNNRFTVLGLQIN